MDQQKELIRHFVCKAWRHMTRAQQVLIFRWRLAAASASSPHFHAAAIHRAGGRVVRGRGRGHTKDGDAAAGAGDPPLHVEVAAELRHQLPRVPHRLAAQVRLRRHRPRPRRRLAAAPAARHGWWLPASSAAPGGVWWGDSGCSASSYYSPRAAGAARLVRDCVRGFTCAGPTRQRVVCGESQRAGRGGNGTGNNWRRRGVVTFFTRIRGTRSPVWGWEGGWPQCQWTVVVEQLEGVV